MTDNERNIRTLIVSFVIAVMVMVPLRMLEYGQNGSPEVLGVKSSKVSCLTQGEASRRREVLLAKVRDQALTIAETNWIRGEMVKIKRLVCR